MVHIAAVPRKDGVARLPTMAARLRTVVGRHPEFLASPAALVLLLAAWEFGPGWLGISTILIPPPSEAFQAAVEGLFGGNLLSHLAITCWEALAGFAIGIAAAFIVGGITAYSRLFERTIYGYLLAIQTMPKVALAPLFIAWLGFGLASKVVVAALLSFFPVLVNVVVGLKRCEPGKIDIMRTLAASELQIFRFVRLPNALPYVFSGLNVAIVFALTGAIAAEFIGSREGLGYAMLMANAEMNMPRTFAILALLGFVGFISMRRLISRQGGSSTGRLWFRRTNGDGGRHFDELSFCGHGSHRPLGRACDGRALQDQLRPDDDRNRPRPCRAYLRTESELLAGRKS